MTPPIEITVRIKTELDEDAYNAAKRKIDRLHATQGLIPRIRRVIFGSSAEYRRTRNMVNTHADLIENMLDIQLDFSRRLHDLEGQHIHKEDEI